MQEIQKRVIEYNESVTSFSLNDSPHGLLKMLSGELGELTEAIEHDKPAIEVASEIGDLLFLLTKLCYLLGISFDDAMEMKLLRNLEKYPPELCNGSKPYQEMVVFCKQEWERKGGDKAFYERYSNGYYDPQPMAVAAD